MALFKKLALILICFCLTSGSYISFSMACCKVQSLKNNGDSLQSESSMPCHDIASTEGENVDQGSEDNFCFGCECYNCVQITMFHQQQNLAEKNLLAVYGISSDEIHSLQPEDIFQPPKLIS
jgi:hypothetical protein